LGIYLGAKFQKKMPQKALSLLLTAIILFIAFQYIWPFFKP